MEIVKYDNIHIFPDPNTEKFLLPHSMGGGDNSKVIENYKKALKVAIDTMLTREDRDIIFLCFEKDLPQKEIAKILNISDSTVSKKKNNILKTLKIQLEFFEKAYTAIRKNQQNEN